MRGIGLCKPPHQPHAGPADSPLAVDSALIADRYLPPVTSASSEKNAFFLGELMPQLAGTLW